MAGSRFVVRIMSEKSKELPTLIKKLRDLLPDCQVSVDRDKPNPTKKDRLEEAQSSFEDSKSIVEELKDEMQEWHDNLPEAFQEGEKGSAIEDAVAALEDLISNMENCDFDVVEFP